MDYQVFRYARLEPKTSFYYSNGKGLFSWSICRANFI